jgi:hypothetical protein
LAAVGKFKALTARGVERYIFRRRQRHIETMNSNNHPSAYGYQPSRFGGNYHQRPPVERPRVPEVTLKELFVQIERKLFVLALKQNERGRFLRLTEEANSRHTTVIVPSSGLQELHQALGEMIAAGNELPPPPAPPEAPE